MKSAKRTSLNTSVRMLQVCVIWRFGFGEGFVQNVLDDKESGRLGGIGREIKNWSSREGSDLHGDRLG